MEQSFPISIEEIEAGIGAALLADTVREFVELIPSLPGILDGGEELQVSAARVNTFETLRSMIY